MRPIRISHSNTDCKEPDLSVIIETCICIKKRSVPLEDGMQEPEVFFHYRNKKYAGTRVYLWTF